MSELRDRLETIFSRFKDLNIVMLGDFFIDQYIDLSRELSETSLETGLEAYQVVDIRNQLGAAGTVANNLCAMGVKVKALTMRGDDANGFVMAQLMNSLEIDQTGVVVDDGIFTPTYVKPMMTEINVETHELNRLDIKNRTPIGTELRTQLVATMSSITHDVDAVLITDQVQEAECGVLTKEMRIALKEVGVARHDRPIWVDSRERGHLFEGVSLKTNLAEARKAMAIPEGDFITAETASVKLYQRNQKPVLITDGVNGIAYCDDQGNGIVPALQMEPPLDIVGAGDSVLAAVGCAMAVGASLQEAALIGCLAASVTIKKIGTTGTASIEEMMGNLQVFEKQNPNFQFG